MSSRWTDDIEALLEKFRFLQIMNKALEETYKQSDKEISKAPVPVTTNNNVQAVMPKNMVPNPEWFNRDWIKFENWWKEMQLFFKSNRVMETNDRITVILIYLRKDVVGIYIQKKVDGLDEELET